MAKPSVGNKYKVIPKIGQFYKKFIKDLLALVKPFINLLKKERSFEWKAKW
jgi:hypothetical protein